MPKNLLQDMVRVKRSRPEAQTPSAEPKGEVRQEVRLDGVEREVSSMHHRGGGKAGTRRTFWFVAAVSVIFFLFALSYLFLKVVITVNPKIEDIVLNENLSAVLGGGGEALPFDLVVISGEESKIIQTTEEKDVSQKAEGIAVIYNTFSSASQVLSIDTRLEGSNGKMYKTKTKLTVPGMKSDGTPGSVLVGIYAAEAGAEYNSAPLDFKIFGFKGTPKYAKFYGRSNGEITGGLIGKFPSIPESEKASIIDEMKTALEAKLFKKAAEQIPSGFILFKDAVFLDTEGSGVDVSLGEGGTLPVVLRGTLYGLLFDEQKLSKKIAEESIIQNDGSEVFIPNIRDLDFSLAQKESISFADVKNINFNLSGNVQIVFKVDNEKLVSDLLGKSKKDFNQILLQYPNIDSADLAISPFWKTSIPKESEDIKVIVNYPEN